jgi:hypothetical protein
MTRKLAMALAALLTLAACSKDAQEQPQQAASALDLITMEALEAHVAYLASDELEGRLTGEPGYDAAAEYVAQQFATLGLEPGGDDGWYQQVPLITYKADPDSTTLVAHRDGKDTEFVYKEHFLMSGDKVRSETFVRGEVVYVGFGVHAPEFGYSDYEGIDVKGKIVAGFSNAPAALPHNERAYYASRQTKTREAASRGAIGSIGLISRRAETYYPWERMRNQFGNSPGMEWVTLTGEAADYVPEIAGSAILNIDVARSLFDGTPISFDDARAATEASTPASAPLGFEVTMARETRIDSTTSPNVIGIVRGTDPELADEYVVYSAHLDHTGIGPEVNGDSIYNGAYDNAMGVSLLIEAARAFAASPPRRSVLFIAVTGEERGLLGSDYFAHYPTVPTDSMVANINLDMPLFLYPLADIIAFGAEHSSLETTIRDAIVDEGFELTLDPMPEENLFIRSDQYSFVKQGVPSTFLVPGFSSTDPEIDGQAIVEDHRRNHYHRPSDDMSQPFHWESALRFARANVRIGATVGDTEERPTWNEGDFFGEKFGR